MGFAVTSFGLSIENTIDLIAAVAVFFGPAGKRDTTLTEEILTCSEVIVVSFVDAMMFVLYVIDYENYCSHCQ